MFPRSLSLACVLALSAITGTAIASPPPNYSQQVYLCNSHLQAKVDITFGQTGTTASVLTQSGQVKDNPFVAGVPTGQPYSVFVAASIKPNASASWSDLSAQQDGTVGTSQSAISIGNSTFIGSGCQIKGSVILSTGCPSGSGMSNDYKTIERTWVGCGL